MPQHCEAGSSYRISAYEMGDGWGRRENDEKGEDYAYMMVMKIFFAKVTFWLKAIGSEINHEIIKTKGMSLSKAHIQRH